MALTPEQKARLKYLKEQDALRKQESADRKKKDAEEGKSREVWDKWSQKRAKEEEAYQKMRADANKENESYDAKHAKAQENINTITSEEKSLSSQINKLYKDKSKQAAKITLAGKDHSKLIAKQLKQEAFAAKSIGKAVVQMDAKATAAQEAYAAGTMTEKQSKAAVKKAQKGRNIAEEHIELLKEMGTGMLDISALQDKSNELLLKKDEIVKTLGPKEYKSMQEQIKGRIDLQKAMKLTEQRMETMDALTGGMASTVKGMVTQWKEMGTGMALKLGLLAGIATLAIAINAQADEIGDAFGAIGVNKFRGELSEAKATAVGLGYDFAAVQESVEALTGTLGIGVGEAAKLSESTMDTARAMGMTASEAAGLTAILATTTGLSAEGAQNFMKQTALLATAAGVAPTDVMADMAGSSEEIATYSKDSGNNMAEAAVKARQMGMALGDVASIADNLLDFSSSIEAEMQASVMTGKALNFQRARELALAGDLVGLQNEILTQVGSEAEWNELNALQRKSMAESIGVSVDQMAKMVKHAGKSTKELMKLSQMDAAELVSEDAIGSITLLTNKLKQIGYTILADIGKWLEDNETVVDEIAATIEFIGKGLAKVVTFVVSFWKQLLIGYGIFKAIMFVQSGSAANMWNMAKGAKEWVKNLAGGKGLAEKVMGSKGKMVKVGGKAHARDQKTGFFDKTKEASGTTGEGVPEKGIGDKLKDLAEGLKAMGNTKVLKGALNLIPTGIGFIALIPGIPGLLFMGKVGLPQLLPNFTGLSSGLTLMGTGSVLKGIGVTALMGIAMLLALPAIPFLAFMALPLGPFWFATFTGLAGGLAALGANIGQVLLGVLAIALLGAALIPATYAFSLLAGVDPMTIVAFSVSLLVLGAAVFGLGMLMFSGIGALVFGAGILALIALGGAVMLLAQGMKMAAPHLDSFKQTFMGLAAEVAELDILASAMHTLAGGLEAVGTAAEPAAKKLAPVVDKTKELSPYGDELVKLPKRTRTVDKTKELSPYGDELVKLPKRPKVEVKKPKVKMTTTMGGLTDADKMPDGSYKPGRVQQAIAEKESSPDSYQSKIARYREEREERKAKADADKPALLKAVGNLNETMKNILDGMGGKDAGKGGFAKLIAKATGKNKLQLKTDVP